MFIIGRFIGANEIGGTLIRLLNNQALRARNALDNADVSFLKVNTSDKPEFLIFPFTPASAPTQNYEVANKKYVDDQVGGVTPGKACEQEVITISGTDITNKYVTLAHTPAAKSVQIMLDGGGDMIYGVAYTVSTNKIDWTGLALDGVIAANDKMQITYLY
jgi:hypothetical protein